MKKLEGYRDVISDDPYRKMPLILRDVTSVEFPKGWTKAHCDEWRIYARLERPRA